jgi:hypothetical protein
MLLWVGGEGFGVARSLEKDPSLSDGRSEFNLTSAWGEKKREKKREKEREKEREKDREKDREKRERERERVSEREEGYWPCVYQHFARNGERFVQRRAKFW